MSIYPKGVSPEKLSSTFEYAALNLPVPDDLLEPVDAQEWQAYLRNVPASQLVRTFGQALDQLHQLTGTKDPSKLPEDQQALAFSKWYAASITNALLQPKFHFVTQEMDENPRLFKSDIERGIYSLSQFLESVNSADTGIWEQRLKAHQEIDRKNFLPLLNKFSAQIQESEESRLTRTTGQKPRP